MKGLARDRPRSGNARTAFRRARMVTVNHAKIWRMEPAKFGVLCISSPPSLVVGRYWYGYRLFYVSTYSVYVGPQIGMNPESLWGLPNLEY